MRSRAVAAVGGAVVLVLSAAAIFTLSIYALASMPHGDLSAWQSVAVAWSIVGITGALFLVVGAVMLAIWAFVT